MAAVGQDVPIQLGGGIRDLETIERYLDIGVSYIIIGTAAERSGLGRFVARSVLKPFLGSYPSLLFGILMGCGALGLLVPSTMGRLAITLPIVISLAKEVGYAQGSNGYAAAILTAVAGNFLTAYGILPANLVNVIANVPASCP